MGRPWTYITLVAVTLIVAIVTESEGVAIEYIQNEIPTECPKKDPMDTTVHLAHEWDCTKFYVCDHGKRVLFECPLMDANGNRLHFNPVLQVCDWPKNAGCLSGRPTTSEKTTAGEVASTQPTTSLRPTWPSTTEWPSTQTTTETTSTSQETSPTYTTTSTTVRTTWPETTEWPSTQTTTETTSTSQETSPTPTTTPTTVRTTWPETTEWPSTQTTTEPTSTTHETSPTPTNTPTTVQTTWPETTEWPSTQTTTETASTSHETSPTPTNSPTTVRTTWPETTEWPSTQTTTETASTSHETSQTPTNTPTTVRTTWPETTEWPSTQTTTETASTSHETSQTPTNTPTTVRTTWPETTEWPSTQTTTETASTSHETSQTPTNSPTTVRTTWPETTEWPSTQTTTETASTSHETSQTPTNTPTTIRTTWPETTEWPSTQTTAEPTSTSHETSPTPTNTPTTVRTTWPETTEWPSTQTTIEPTSTSHETSPTPTNSPTTVRTTWPETTEWPSTQTTTEPTSTSHETSPTPTNTPTTVRTTWPETTEWPSTQTTTEPTSTSRETSPTPTNTPTTVSTIWPDVSTEPATSWYPNTTQVSTTSPTENTPVPTGDVDQTGTPTPSGIYVPHESNCSLFYEIINGTKNPRECPRGQHFSPTALTCMWPGEAGCESTTPIPVETTTEAKPTCAPCGNINHGSLVPHECACDKYYWCSNGDLILRECPKGLHYNPKIFSCDFPESAGCQQTTTTVMTTRKSTTVANIPSQCPPDNSGHTVQIPHPTNCSLYYKCENGQKQLMECPGDLHFNAALQMCDWRESAGCVATTEPSTTIKVTTKPTTSGAKSSTDDYNDNTVTIATSITPTECPPDNSGPLVLLPHPYNCSLFYICNNGQRDIESCPRGLEFNAQTRQCDWPEFAGCHPWTTEIPWTTWKWSTPSTVSSERPTTPPNTSSERSTTGRTTITETRPSKTTTKWVTLSMSTKEDSTRWTTPKPAVECPPDVSDVQIPHENDCSLYYECENGIKVLKKCTSGLHFSPALEICVWPEYADCESTTISPETSSISANTPSTITTSTTAVDAGLLTCVGTCPKKEPHDNTFLLPNKDCRKFCKCTNSQPYVYDCPAELHFNPIKKVCDYPRRAKCQGEGGYGHSKAEPL